MSQNTQTSPPSRNSAATSSSAVSNDATDSSARVSVLNKSISLVVLFSVLILPGVGAFLGATQPGLLSAQSLMKFATVVTSFTAVTEQLFSGSDSYVVVALLSVIGAVIRRGC